MARFDIEWVVPIVVMIVYALSAVFKAKDQADPKVAQPPRRNTGQELDRFLQEIDRLRRQQESRGPVSLQQTDVVVEDEEEPTAQRSVVVVREQRPAPLLPRPMVFRMQPVPPAPPSAPIAEEINRTPQVVLPSSAPNVRSDQKSVPNPAITALRMIRDRQNVAAAFALIEILGPPKCKRQGR